MRCSIRYQLLVPLLTLLLGVAGISSWTAVAAGQRAWEQIETQVRKVAEVFSQAHYPLTPEVLQHIAGLSGAEYVLVHSDGRLTTTLGDAEASNPSRALGSLRQTLAEQLPAPDTVVEDYHALALDSRLTVNGVTYLTSGVRLKPPRAGTRGTLYILYPEQLWRDALWQAVRPSLQLGGFVALAALALAFVLSQRLARRIQELERRTRLIAAGDFSPMPLTGRNDELRDLGRSVNEMALRLAQLQEAVQKAERLRLLGQVSGGLAHQLRNGVTGAILAVQLHARDCDSGDPEALEVALRQLALLEANLKRFLDLGRAEELHREPCTLNAIIEEAVTLLRPQCRHAHIQLRWQAPAEPITIAGDAARLGHLVLNVLGNAIEAAGPGGRVEIRLTRQGGNACIEVLDSGPGPPPELAPRLFEPFATSKPEGIGLGLAVARQAALAHGGRIEWRRLHQQTCFDIVLPAVTSH